MKDQSWFTVLERLLTTGAGERDLSVLKFHLQSRPENTWAAGCVSPLGVGEGSRLPVWCALGANHNQKKADWFPRACALLKEAGADLGADIKSAGASRPIIEELLHNRANPAFVQALLGFQPWVGADTEKEREKPAFSLLLTLMEKAPEERVKNGALAMAVPSYGADLLPVMQGIVAMAAPYGAELLPLIQAIVAQAPSILTGTYAHRLWERALALGTKQEDMTVLGLLVGEGLHAQEWVGEETNKAPGWAWAMQWGVLDWWHCQQAGRQNTQAMDPNQPQQPGKSVGQWLLETTPVLARRKMLATLHRMGFDWLSPPSHPSLFQALANTGEMEQALGKETVDLLLAAARAQGLEKAWENHVGFPGPSIVKSRL